MIVHSLNFNANLSHVFMSAYTLRGCNRIEIENRRENDSDGKKKRRRGGSGRERGYIGTRGIGKVGLSTREASIMHGPRSRCGRQISSIEKEVQKEKKKIKIKKEKKERKRNNNHNHKNMEKRNLDEDKE